MCITHEQQPLIPRQRTHHNKETYDFPDDFAERLKGFRKESGPLWSEIARRLGTYRHTVWRRKAEWGRPNDEHVSPAGPVGGPGPATTCVAPLA